MDLATLDYARTHTLFTHAVQELTVVCLSRVVAVAWSRARTGTHREIRDVELERPARWVSDGVERVCVPFRVNSLAGSYRSAVWTRIHLHGHSSQQAEYSNNFHFDRQ